MFSKKRTVTFVLYLTLLTCLGILLTWNYTRKEVTLLNFDQPRICVPSNNATVEAETKENSDVQKFLDEGVPVEDEAKIVQYIQAWHLDPPAPLTKPYRFYPAKKNPKSDIEKQLMEIFKNKKPGFFVEAGANDGEMLSNTLWLEQEQNWTGLLIEPNSFMVPDLRLSNRRAWIADVCLSIEAYPMKVRFLHRDQPGWWTTGHGFIQNTGIRPDHEQRNLNEFVYAGAVDCFPLHTLLLAVNRTEVDYFSLDVEGVEFKILSHIPFDRFRIKVISIEHNVIPERYEALEEFLISKNYKVIFKSIQDVIAVHQDYTEEYILPDPNQNITI